MVPRRKALATLSIEARASTMYTHEARAYLPSTLAPLARPHPLARRGRSFPSRARTCPRLQASTSCTARSTRIARAWRARLLGAGCSSTHAITRAGGASAFARHFSADADADAADAAANAHLPNALFPPLARDHCAGSTARSATAAVTRPTSTRSTRATICSRGHSSRTTSFPRWTRTITRLSESAVL